MDAKDFLKQAPLFAGLSPQHLKALGKACTEREFQSGDIIVRQGNPGVGLFIIQSGRVRVEKVTDDGDKIELAEHGPGEVIGELSVIDGATRTASVVALENTQCLVLASWDFNSFLESHPQVALEILPVVVQRFRETNEALIHMQAGKKA